MKIDGKSQKEGSNEDDLTLESVINKCIEIVSKLDVNNIQLNLAEIVNYLFMLQVRLKQEIKEYINQQDYNLWNQIQTAISKNNYFSEIRKLFKGYSEQRILLVITKIKQINGLLNLLETIEKFESIIEKTESLTEKTKIIEKNKEILTNALKKLLSDQLNKSTILAYQKKISRRLNSIKNDLRKKMFNIKTAGSIKKSEVINQEVDLLLKDFIACWQKDKSKMNAFTISQSFESVGYIGRINEYRIDEDLSLRIVEIIKEMLEKATELYSQLEARQCATILYGLGKSMKVIKPYLSSKDILDFEDYAKQFLIKLYEIKSTDKDAHSISTGVYGAGNTGLIKADKEITEIVKDLFQEILNEDEVSSQSFSNSIYGAGEMGVDGTNEGIQRVTRIVLFRLLNRTDIQSNVFTQILYGAGKMGVDGSGQIMQYLVKKIFARLLDYKDNEARPHTFSNALYGAGEMMVDGNNQAMSTFIINILKRILEYENINSKPGRINLSQEYASALLGAGQMGIVESNTEIISVVKNILTVLLDYQDDKLQPQEIIHVIYGAGLMQIHELKNEVAALLGKIRRKVLSNNINLGLVRQLYHSLVFFGIDIDQDLQEYFESKYNLGTTANNVDEKHYEDLFYKYLKKSLPNNLEIKRGRKYHGFDLDFTLYDRDQEIIVDVEYDGKYHNQRKKKDQFRDIVLEKLGIIVHRVDYRDEEEVIIEKIEYIKKLVT